MDQNANSFGISKPYVIGDTTYTSNAGGFGYTSSKTSTSLPTTPTVASPTVSTPPPAPVASPVTTISTSGAATTLNKGLSTLNQISPSTNPAVTITGYKDNGDGTTTNYLSDGSTSVVKLSKNSDGSYSQTEQTSPKAYFMNAAGQEAEYTQDQLNDPTTQKFLSDNGYMQTKTEGPTLLSGQVTADDNQIQTLADTFNSYNVDNDPQFQAKAASIKAQYDELIRQMNITNNQRAKQFDTLGLRSGTSQYAGGVQLGITGEELNQANARIATLTQQESDAIDSARTAYQTGKFTEFNQKMNALSSIRDAKASELQNYNTALAASVKAATDANNLAAKNQYDQVTKPIQDLVIEAQKNGASPDVLKAMSGATSVQDALTAAGDSLTTGTGTVGEYLFYKKQAQAAGQTPVDFNTYQTMDANRKAKATAAASANGLSSSALSKVTTIADQFKTEQAVQNYQTIAQAVDVVKNSGTSPTDDIQRVYAFAKAMDPSSSVREGEYKTVQDYAQALFSSVGIKVARVFDNTGFLTDDARTKMLSTLTGRLGTYEKTYNNIRNSYASRINKISGATDGTDYLTDYSSGDTTQALIDAGKEAKTTVDNYITANPMDAQMVANLYNTEGTTDQDVVDYLKLKKKI